MYWHPPPPKKKYIYIFIRERIFNQCKFLQDKQPTGKFWQKSPWSYFWGMTLSSLTVMAEVSILAISGNNFLIFIAEFNLVKLWQYW